MQDTSFTSYGHAPRLVTKTRSPFSVTLLAFACTALSILDLALLAASLS
jgi:hypothetical protein